MSSDDSEIPRYQGGGGSLLFESVAIQLAKVIWIVDDS